MAIQSYEGKDITVRFDGRKCIHSRMCVLTHPDVFQANVKGPWIFPDNASAEDLAAFARQCPSGAITCERHDGGPDERAPNVNVVRVLEDGPLAVHGDLSINNEKAGFRAMLCRCGASKNKPYCDGSHSKIAFKATGEVSGDGADEREFRDGPVEVTPAPNGPLLVDGNVEIIAGTGRPVTCVQKTGLCRCGGSNNKPFCDGSHVKIGFQTD